MTASLVEKIADAVLYEGYILYPYRPSAVKNQQRWNFGALCPQAYSDAQRGTESWTMQTECLIRSGAETRLNVKVRFLHLLAREVGVPISDLKSEISDLQSQVSEFQTIASLEVNGRLFQTWQEAVEREVSIPAISLDVASAQPLRVTFSFPATDSIEPLADEASGGLAGVLVRRQQAIDGAVEVSINEGRSPSLRPSGSATEAHNPQFEGLSKITVKILNLTQFEKAGERTRDDALMRSLVSTHTILNVENGECVSLLDPPAACAEAAASCSNVGTYPVLVGEEGTRDCMLSSPIILYDYPQIAPESAGNLYDGTEIDEILTLRIMTLTEEEKREMRGADDRARQILERTETLPMEQLMKMHGAMRTIKPKGTGQ